MNTISAKTFATVMGSVGATVTVIGSDGTVESSETYNRQPTKKERNEMTETAPQRKNSESLLETLDILADDDLMAALAEADDDVDNGDLEDLEEN